MVEFNPEKHVRTPDKPCRTCGGEIRYKKTRKSREVGDCVSCDSKRKNNYYINNRKKVLKSSKNYYDKNSDRLKEKNKNYRRENRERFLEYSAEFYFNKRIEDLGVAFSSYNGDEKISREEFLDIVDRQEISPEKFAKEIGLTSSAYYQVKSGRYNPGYKITYAVRQWQAAQNKTDEPDWS